MSVDIRELKKLDFFSAFTEKELDGVNRIIKEVSYAPGEVVFEEGSEGHTLYIVITGEAKVTKKDPEGREQVLTLLKDGDICGEMSFLDGRPHSATITAVHSMRVIQIEKADFDRFVEEYPKAAYKIMMNIVFQVDSIVRRMNTTYVDMISYMFGRRRF